MVALSNIFSLWFFFGCYSLISSTLWTSVPGQIIYLCLVSCNWLTLATSARFGRVPFTLLFNVVIIMSSFEKCLFVVWAFVRIIKHPQGRDKGDLHKYSRDVVTTKQDVSPFRLLPATQWIISKTFIMGSFFEPRKYLDLLRGPSPKYSFLLDFIRNSECNILDSSQRQVYMCLQHFSLWCFDRNAVSASFSPLHRICKCPFLVTESR